MRTRNFDDIRSALVFAAAIQELGARVTHVERIGGVWTVAWEGA